MPSGLRSFLHFHFTSYDLRELKFYFRTPLLPNVHHSPDSWAWAVLPFRSHPQRTWHGMKRKYMFVLLMLVTPPARTMREHASMKRKTEGEKRPRAALHCSAYRLLVKTWNILYFHFFPVFISKTGKVLNKSWIDNAYFSSNTSICVITRRKYQDYLNGWDFPRAASRQPQKTVFLPTVHLCSAPAFGEFQRRHE